VKENKDLSDRCVQPVCAARSSSHSTGSHVVPVVDGVPVDPEVLVSCLFVSFSPKLGNC